MKNPNEHSLLRALAERLETDFGAGYHLDAKWPMLDVRLGGQLFVVDYDNGPSWQPRNLFRVAHVTDDYAFNLSNDPSFATLDLAEQYLRTKLSQYVSANRKGNAYG